MKYELYRGQVALGVITHEMDDFPFHKGTFMPSKEFANIASLFDREISLLESHRIAEWQEVRDEIDAPGIRLESLEGGGKTIMNPLLHIDGSEAWWR
jgi:hypothetical protein